MNMISPNIILVLFIAVIRYSHNQVADNRCMKVPLIQDFDLQKLEGIWYVQQVGDDDEAARKCSVYRLKTDEKKTAATLFVQRIFKKSNSTNKITEPYIWFQVKNTSEYRMRWKDECCKAAWTIGTDYKSWVTWYLCFPEEKDKGIVFLFTREKRPSNKTIEKARYSASNIGFRIDESYLKSVDHSGCSY